jgi:hypothetical protein
MGSSSSDEIQIQGRQVGEFSHAFEWTNPTTQRAFEMLASEQHWPWTEETLASQRSDLLRAQTLAVSLRLLFEAQGGDSLVTDFAVLTMRNVDWDQLVEQLVIHRYKLQRQDR